MYLSQLVVAPPLLALGLGAQPVRHQLLCRRSAGKDRTPVRLTTFHRRRMAPPVDPSPHGDGDPGALEQRGDNVQDLNRVPAQPSDLFDDEHGSIGGYELKVRHR